MIAYLQGEIKHKEAGTVTIMAGGVGYELNIPLSTFYDLPEEGRRAELFVKTVAREDDLLLFGFLTLAEKKAFLLLTSVSKIGPRVALNILSGITPGELVQAVNQKNTARLSSIPGIGAKTAERLIMELKDKINTLAAAPGGLDATETTPPIDQDGEDALSALINLGYSRPEAAKAVTLALASAGEKATLETLIRLSLKRLRKA